MVTAGRPQRRADCLSPDARRSPGHFRAQCGTSAVTSRTEATVAPTLLPALDEDEAAPMVTDEAELATVPETAALPESATAPAPAATMVGQPHLTAEGLSAALLPGPVPHTCRDCARTLAAPAPLPNSFDIFDALP